MAYLTRSQFRGTYFLAFAVAGLIALNTSYNRYRLSLPFAVSDSLSDRRLLDSLLTHFPAQDQQAGWANFNEGERQPFKDPTPKPLHLHAFDPNTVDKETWLEMGLPERVFSGLSRYREKGGMIRKPEQILKLYHLPPETGRKMLPFVRLDSSKWDRKAFVRNRTQDWKRPERTVFDLNTADSLQLDGVPGIGGKTATRILQYRERLGGFLVKEQLYEIYRIDSLVVLNLVKASFISGDFVPRKLALNVVGEEVLAQHPYIRKGLARILIRYRQQHGPYQSPEDLKGIRILDAPTLERIKPYLDFRTE